MIALIVFQFEITREGLLAETGSMRAVDRVLKALNWELANYWWRHFLKRHFEPGAAGKYGYQARTEQWRARKRQLFERGYAKAPDQDLVFRGEMQENLGSYVDIRAYPTRFSATMHGPRYVTMTPRDPTKPNLGKEVTTLAPEEEDQMGRLAERLLPKIIQLETGGQRKTEAVR